MHDELNRVRTKPAFKEIKCETKPLDEQAEIWTEYMRLRDDSIMTDNFQGQLMSRISCLSCKHHSATFDNFMDLSIEIPRKAIRFLGSISLNDCLKTFFSSERMIDCGFKCDGCKQ
jgi:ubiquitin C-terminal hydrolase